MTFKLTDKQLEAQSILSGQATYCMLFGGSRSGKTALHIRNIVLRALKAPGSRHCILRFRFNHIVSSIIEDTFPKMMKLAFPGVDYQFNRSSWFARFANGSEIWFGGLDDSKRTEKILGNEYSTIYLNECSQISYDAVQMVITRLAQKVDQVIEGRDAKALKPRLYFDCNPPSKLHWSYRMFHDKADYESKKPIPNPENFVAVKMNPADNAANVSAEYLETLKSLPARYRKRFLEGEYADANPDALFTDENFDTWRITDGALPDFTRIIISVDPSGSEDVNNAANDCIGICVVGLGDDGYAYLLEDLTIKGSPEKWGRVVAQAFDRHGADLVVGETNYGGAMVRSVIQSCRPNTPFQAVSASRGKCVRAEPISVLYEQGKVRHVGRFNELEEELCSFSTKGYLGDKSPNRADALVWAITALFPGMVNAKKAIDHKALVVPTVNHFGNRRLS